MHFHFHFHLISSHLIVYYEVLYSIMRTCMETCGNSNFLFDNLLWHEWYCCSFFCLFLFNILLFLAFTSYKWTTETRSRSCVWCSVETKKTTRISMTVVPIANKTWEEIYSANVQVFNVNFLNTIQRNW